MNAEGTGRLLVLGGARSGKSRYAQERAEGRSGELVFVATAQPFDEEMRDRIAHHRADRGDRWSTIEVPLDLPGCILSEARAGRVLLVDCLTLWTSNILLAERDVEQEAQRLQASIAAADGAIILVSNEVGLGIVPDNSLARRFRDAAGSINQAVARICDNVVFVAAGLPMHLK
ncbi:bifunctional adenosylcobinamide kinase/adenosylcobinamide-phosphate guanylyltransferase [Rhizorhabdus argentea]|uniref:bifunctional adenosylcobinamide kinase/adenosylcobinamide-phosphate guanylyltransferase n=1 Tax=Rhizorhabdus argentea TaxID=1387174 RepID=UPI0030ED8F12